jgi:hypothetical protein
MSHADVVALMGSAVLVPGRLRALSIAETEEALAFRGHLAECEECRSEVRAWQTVDEALVAVTPVSVAAPTAARSRILSSVLATGVARGPDLVLGAPGRGASLAGTGAAPMPQGAGGAPLRAATPDTRSALMAAGARPEPDAPAAGRVWRSASGAPVPGPAPMPGSSGPVAVPGDFAGAPVPGDAAAAPVPGPAPVSGPTPVHGGAPVHGPAQASGPAPGSGPAPVPGSAGPAAVPGGGPGASPGAHDPTSIPPNGAGPGHGEAPSGRRRLRVLSGGRDADGVGFRVFLAVAAAAVFLFVLGAALGGPLGLIQGTTAPADTSGRVELEKVVGRMSDLLQLPGAMVASLTDGDGEPAGAVILAPGNTTLAVVTRALEPLPEDGRYVCLLERDGVRYEIGYMKFAGDPEAPGEVAYWAGPIADDVPVDAGLPGDQFLVFVEGDTGGEPLLSTTF